MYEKETGKKKKKKKEVRTDRQTDHEKGGRVGFSSKGKVRTGRTDRQTDRQKKAAEETEIISQVTYSTEESTMA